LDNNNKSEIFQNIKDKIIDLDEFVFLTGAGISQESGIPTFRGAEGLWRKYDPMILASISGFNKNPKLVWEFYKYRQELICNCNPNLGHRAIAEFQKIKNSSVLTQNIDGLHEKAGTKNIVELHGNILRMQCTECEFQETIEQKIDQPLPPVCKICKNILRPSVILFGEPLNPDRWKEAERLSSDCDVMFIVGTSLNVGPVNQLPLYAKRNGAILVEVNPEPTTVFNEIMDYSIQGSATEILPQLLQLQKIKY
jgi:NAD-dependent deacetylase